MSNMEFPGYMVRRIQDINMHFKRTQFFNSFHKVRLPR